ncbi:MAG: alpha/beta hydrolase-fold protein [Chloroflexota bacterium]|nr:alpha/beta hydrolase-fold protein [Chloroflexota bacterium]
MSAQKQISWLVIMLCFLVIGTAAAQTSQPDSQPIPITLGDTITDTLQPSEAKIYQVNLVDADLPVDIVLFSQEDAVIRGTRAEGHPIPPIDRMFGYGFEVLTILPGGIIPATIEVRINSIVESTEYSLSILPTDPQVSEAPIPGEQVKRWDEIEIGTASRPRKAIVPYLLYVPEDYDRAQTYPLIFFMHGYGETGTRLDFLKTQVLPELIENGQDFPFMIISPQVTYGEDWASVSNRSALFIQHLQTEFPIDPNRIYIAGLSMGGSGAWHFALTFPDVPAAVVSMAGYYSYGSARVPDTICDISAIPFWVVHSEQDESVNFNWEAALVDGVRDCGGEVEFTTYPDATHEQTFERGFADPTLYTWLLEQAK